MNRLITWTIIAFLIPATSVAGATLTEKSIAAKDNATGRSSLCSMVAESRLAKSGGMVKLAI